MDNNKYSEEDGVVYEPSNDSTINKTTNKMSNKKQVSSTKPKKRRKRPDKSEFTMFYVITVLIGIIVFLSVFGLVYAMVSSKSSNKNSQTSKNDINTEVNITDEQISDEELVIEDKNVVKITAVVKIMNAGNDVIVVKDVNTDIEYSLIVDVNTQIKNEFEQAIALAEIKVGDVVEVEFDKNSSTANKISKSTNSWEKTMVKGAEVNEELKTIKLGDSIYNYKEDVIVTYNGAQVDISEIDPIDYITVIGVGNEVVSINIDKSHGKINVVNSENVENGVIEIDTNIYMNLSEAEEIKLTEGEHKVVVKGSNIDPIVKDIYIEKGQTYTLDLNEAEYKSSKVMVNLTPVDAKFSIDGQDKAANQVIVLPYGTYNFRAEKTGYEPWEGVVNVNQPNITIDINLVEILEQGNLYVSTEPEGGSIYIDGVLKGTTPTNLLLDYGQHELSIKKEGYYDFTMQVNISEQDLSYNLTLHPADPLMP